MDQNKPVDTKRKWRKPEIIDVGDIREVTAGGTDNVRDPGSNPMTYDLSISRDPDEEVDLGDR